MSTFPERLAASMTEQRYNNSSLGKALGVTHSTVARWLNGSIPSGETLQKLAQVLNVNAPWLIANEGAKRAASPENIAAMTQAVRGMDYESAFFQYLATLKPEEILQGVKTIIDSAPPKQTAQTTLGQVAAMLKGAGQVP